MGSDSHFLEILPRLKSGVFVYIDDIYLPYDYPPIWRNRYYSEQYLLATVLLYACPSHYEIMLPCVFIEDDDELSSNMRSLLNDISHPGNAGNGFWFKTK